MLVWARGWGKERGGEWGCRWKGHALWEFCWGPEAVCMYGMASLYIVGLGSCNVNVADEALCDLTVMELSMGCGVVGRVECRSLVL